MSKRLANCLTTTGRRVINVIWAQIKYSVTIVHQRNIVYKDYFNKWWLNTNSKWTQYQEKLAISTSDFGVSRFFPNVRRFNPSNRVSVLKLYKKYSTSIFVHVIIDNTHLSYFFLFLFQTNVRVFYKIRRSESQIVTTIFYYYYQYLICLVSAHWFRSTLVAGGYLREAKYLQRPPPTFAQLKKKIKNDTYYSSWKTYYITK